MAANIFRDIAIQRTSQQIINDVIIIYHVQKKLKVLMESQQITA